MIKKRHYEQTDTNTHSTKKNGDGIKNDIINWEAEITKRQQGKRLKEKKNQLKPPRMIRHWEIQNWDFKSKTLKDIGDDY